MAYIEVDIIIPEKPETGREITVAELGTADYESFMDTDSGLKAYIPEEYFNRELLDSLTIVGSKEFGEAIITTRIIKDTNWNARWEANYKPVSIPGFCYIRSPFHPRSDDHEYEVIIEPKMSFGTGHHETTWLMVAMMKRVEFEGRKVLDLGCGTGILSILSSLLGANRVTGIDIDQWAYNNSIDNLEVNKITNCKIIQGDISAVGNEKYDIILANITRNINIGYMSNYKELLSPNGFLLLSGFYSEDVDMIKKAAASAGFAYLEHKLKKNWASVLFLSQE